MGWYRFDKDNPVGIPRIKEYIVAFYDERTGECYDEARYAPEDLYKAMCYTMEPLCKVFAVLDERELYELILTRVKE